MDPNNPFTPRERCDSQHQQDTGSELRFKPREASVPPDGAELRAGSDHVPHVPSVEARIDWNLGGMARLGTRGGPVAQGTISTRLISSASIS